MLLYSIQNCGVPYRNSSGFLLCFCSIIYFQFRFSPTLVLLSSPSFIVSLHVFNPVKIWDIPV